MNANIWGKRDRIWDNRLEFGIPDYANFLAMDKDGEWYAFSHRPVRRYEDSDCWILPDEYRGTGKGSDCDYIADQSGHDKDIDWVESVLVRPGYIDSEVGRSEVSPTVNAIRQFAAEIVALNGGKAVNAKAIEILKLCDAIGE